MKVLYFTSQTCAPCKTLKPIAQEVSLETGVPIEFIDVAQNMPLAQSYRVTSVPTLIAVSNGQVKWRHTGLASKQSLKHYFSIK
tara:strand:+ start:138 stop:389 length:252 start_codon:yes stop_codon:yes gene_type:complete